MSKGTINKVIIIGRLGADPDVRYTASGTAVAKFNVATDERVPAGEGNWEDRTEWHRIVAFGKLAEICGNYLSKGRLVFLEGSLRTQQWEDAQGVKRYTTEIVARDIQFLGSSEGRGQQAQPQGAKSAPAVADAPGPSAGTYTDELPATPNAPDDDIPF